MNSAPESGVFTFKPKKHRTEPNHTEPKCQFLLLFSASVSVFGFAKLSIRLRLRSLHISCCSYGSGRPRLGIPAAALLERRPDGRGLGTTNEHVASLWVIPATYVDQHTSPQRPQLANR
jgi:hypothetical protein